MKYLLVLFMLCTSLFSFYLSDSLPKETVQLVDSFECFSEDDKVVLFSYVLALKYRMEHVGDRETLVKSDLEYWRLWHLVSNIADKCDLSNQFDNILGETATPTKKEKRTLGKLRRTEGSIHTEGSSEFSEKMSKLDEKLQKKLLLSPPRYNILKKSPYLHDYNLSVLKNDPKMSISKDIYDELEKRNLKSVKRDLLFRYVLLQEERRRNYDQPKKRRDVEQELIYLAKCQRYHQNYLQIPYKPSFIRQLADRVSSRTSFYPGLKKEFLPKEIEEYCEHNITHSKVTTYTPKKDKSLEQKEVKITPKLKNLTEFLKQYQVDSVKSKYAKEYLGLMKSELEKSSTSTPSIESLRLLRVKNCLVEEDHKKDFELILARVKDFRIEGLKETFYRNIFNSQRWWKMTIKMKMDIEGTNKMLQHFFDCNQTLLEVKRPSSPVSRSSNPKILQKFNRQNVHNAIRQKDSILKYYAEVFNNKPTPNLTTEEAIEKGIIAKEWLDESGNIRAPLGKSVKIEGMPEGGIKLTYKGIPKGKSCTQFIQLNKNNKIFFNRVTYDGVDYIMLNTHKIKLQHYVFKYVERLCNSEENNITISFVKEKTMKKYEYKGWKKIDSVFGKVKKIKSIDENQYEPNSFTCSQSGNSFVVSGENAKYYDTKIQALARKLPSDLSSSYGMALSPNGETLVVGRYGTTRHIYDMGRNIIVKSVKLQKEYSSKVSTFLSDNKTIVMIRKRVYFYDIEAEKIIAEFEPKFMSTKRSFSSARITAVTESPDGSLLYVGGNKGVIERWKIERGLFGSFSVSYFDQIEQGDIREVGALRFDENNPNILIIGSRNVKIKWMDIKQRKVLKTYMADEFMDCKSIVVSADKKYMLAVGDHGVFLWRLDDVRQYDILKGGRVVGGVFLNNSSEFILAGRKVSIWKTNE